MSVKTAVAALSLVGTAVAAPFAVMGIAHRRSNAAWTQISAMCEIDKVVERKVRKRKDLTKEQQDALIEKIKAKSNTKRRELQEKLDAALKAEEPFDAKVEKFGKTVITVLDGAAKATETAANIMEAAKSAEEAKEATLRAEEIRNRKRRPIMFGKIIGGKVTVYTID